MYGGSNSFALGYGADLCIWNDSNMNQNSYSHLGDSYELPDGLTY